LPIEKLVEAHSLSKTASGSRRINDPKYCVEDGHLGYTEIGRIVGWKSLGWVMINKLVLTIGGGSDTKRNMKTISNSDKCIGVCCERIRPEV
jgi:hypothetical protein